MRAFIQRFSQQQVGRFLAIALLPFLAAGTFGLIASGVLVAPLLITVPLYGYGLYLYIGYVRIGWFSLGNDKAGSIWKQTVWYNGALACISLVITIGFIAETVRSVDDFLKASSFSLVIAGQIAVALTAHYARGNREYEVNEFRDKIAEIGLE